MNGYGKALSQPRANSYNLCIWSVVKLGLPLLKWVGLEALKGWRIMSVRSVGCRQSLDCKSDLRIHHVFFSMPISRSTITTKGIAALELHKHHNNFGATPHKWEKPKMLPAKEVISVACRVGEYQKHWHIDVHDDENFHTYFKVWS